MDNNKEIPVIGMHIECLKTEEIDDEVSMGIMRLSFTGEDGERMDVMDLNLEQMTVAYTALRGCLDILGEAAETCKEAESGAMEAGLRIK